MKLIKRINCFFDRMMHDVRLFKIKPSLICCGITLALGILSWFIGGRADRVMLFYIFPRSALPIGLMYFLWALSFAIFGLIIGGVLFGCEKFRHQEATKVSIFLIIGFLLSLCIYPIFFRSLSPFIAFVFFVIVLLLCFLALISSIRIYSLWTLLIGMHMLWILYNCYLALTIAMIN
ncbi:MAG: tryptophan-rich sensory protein [Clostridia bacterium]|nr:tryptophan-rich sensory protein [Clostridia bacterium]